MTIYFAAALNHLRPHLRQARGRAVLASPANDNGKHGLHDGILHAALRQFAQHGIGAAQHARRQAERAFFAGDRDTYQWWLGICRTLDRRLAATLVCNPEGESGATQL